MKHIIIYTDGACRGNPGPGGWGVVIQYKHHEKIFLGAERDTTNNRMELTAAVRAFEALKEPCRVDLYTDSQYVQKGISEWLPGWKNRHWKKSDNKPVKNADLWQALDGESSRHTVSWHWIRGHNGHPGNERADALANEAIDALLSGLE